jgi:DinB superfamily
MRKYAFMAKLGLFMLVFFGIAAGPAENELAKKDKKFAAKHLKQSQKNLLKSIKGLSEAQLNFKPAPDKWSIKECVQHLTLAEAGLWQWIQGTLSAPANPDRRADIKMSDADLLKGVGNRTQKAQAPENFQPQNAKWASLDETLAAFKKEREAHIDFMKGDGCNDMRNHVATETPLGALDSYQLVLLLSAHTGRHTEQINEVKANANFPKS